MQPIFIAKIQKTTRSNGLRSHILYDLAKSPVLKSEKTITELGRNSSATEFAQAGAVVMSITRYIRPSILGINACFNQSVVAVIPTNAVHTSFIYPLMLSNVERYMGLRTGAQQPHINKETVKETVFVLPCSKVLTAYYEKVDPVYERQLIAAKENAELESLRDWLLPMLMNGQVKVGKKNFEYEQTAPYMMAASKDELS